MRVTTKQAPSKVDIKWRDAERRRRSLAKARAALKRAAKVTEPASWGFSDCTCAENTATCPMRAAIVAIRTVHLFSIGAVVIGGGYSREAWLAPDGHIIKVPYRCNTAAINIVEYRASLKRGIPAVRSQLENFDGVPVLHQRWVKRDRQVDHTSPIRNAISELNEIGYFRSDRAVVGAYVVPDGQFPLDRFGRPDRTNWDAYMFRADDGTGMEVVPDSMQGGYCSERGFVMYDLGEAADKRSDELIRRWRDGSYRGAELDHLAVTL